MKLHKKIAKLFGYSLVKFDEYKAPTVVPAAVNIIDRYGIGLVLDVDAHDGQYGKALRKDGYTGAIHSFEDVPADFAKLSEACAGDAKWTAHKITLYTRRMRYRNLFCVDEPNGYNKTTFEKRAAMDTEQDNADTTRGDINTLDNFLFGLDGFSGRVFLKMSTLGYDLDVFAGVQKSLDKVAAIQSVLVFKPHYFTDENYLEALKAYRESGFRVAAFYPTAIGKNLLATTMNCLLINENFSE